MSVDMGTWRKVVEQIVKGIADEELQRRAWFGIGPEESSPDEMTNQFFGDAAIEEFLRRRDTRLNDLQIKSGKHLIILMNEFSKQTPEVIDPSKAIDDPRWRQIREAAGRFSDLLSR